MRAISLDYACGMWCMTNCQVYVTFCGIPRQHQSLRPEALAKWRTIVEDIFKLILNEKVYHELNLIQIYSYWQYVSIGSGTWLVPSANEPCMLSTSGLWLHRYQYCHSELRHRIVPWLSFLKSRHFQEKGSQEKVFERTYRATLASHGYLVQRTLGSGSYSKVKTALNCRNSEHIPVAVKIINKLSAPREYQAKFLPRELQTWPKLKHPNIIQLYHTFEDKR